MDYVMYSWEANDVPTILLTKELEELARDPEALVNRIDILLTHGNLSDRSREIIKMPSAECVPAITEMIGRVLLYTL